MLLQRLQRFWLLAAAAGVAATPSVPSIGSNRSSSSRQLIINGVETTPFRFTFQVALFRGDTRKDTFLCGGSLITSRAVLTAGHCFDFDPNFRQNYWVGVHRHNIARDAEDDNIFCSKNIRVVRGVRHPSYQMTPLQNDVAVLQLEEDAPCAPQNTELIQLDQSRELWTGRRAVVIGWGDTDP
uniref:Peptidase S1 domain-containing protein n=2 Tax=Chrysotila carterae TaxID=13221 RepID=A0A7S4BGN1_CHRCT